MKQIVCAICGNNKNTEVLFRENFDVKKIDEKFFSARRLPDKIHYRILKCKKCGLIYSSPILNSYKIARLYKESKFNYESQTANLNKTYGEYLKSLEGRLLAKERFLEIGSGNGFFLEKAKEFGFKNVFGVEPSVESVSKAKLKFKKNIIVDIFKKGQFKEKYFDLICFFQTFDHIPDTNEFLRNCYDILKPGGLIFCICHNTDSIGARIFGEKWPIFDIAHIYLFNKETLAWIFKKNGFLEVSVFDIANTQKVSYWLRMLPMPKFIKSVALSVFDKLPFLDFDLKINVGNIGIIGKKRRVLDLRLNGWI